MRPWRIRHKGRGTRMHLSTHKRIFTLTSNPKDKREWVMHNRGLAEVIRTRPARVWATERRRAKISCRPLRGRRR